MAVPLLPHRVRSSPIIGPQYEAWKTKVLTEGLSEEAIKHEFYIVMKPRWIEQQRQNDKFEADTEKLRKKTDAHRESTEHLRTARQHRFAIPIALQGGTLTPLEVLVYVSESGHPPFNKLMRDPQSIVVRTPLVRTDWLGLVGDPETETNPHVRLFRAWEMLRVDKVEHAPKLEPTQRLTTAQAKASNQVNKNRREIDAAPIVQEVPNPEAFATAPRATRVRAPKVAEPKAVRVPKPAKVYEITEVRGHRGEGDNLEFRVKYAHLSEEKNKKYEWQFARNFANNILVNAYRKEHGL
jgi:hypothetical protein